MAHRDLVKVDTVGGISIYEVSSKVPSFVYKAGFAIDADGSPNCYGPDNSGLDYTANGGTPGGDWWGGPVNPKTGMPAVQAIYDPSPGMYVSGTALIDPSFDELSPYRYTDSERIPFFVLPGNHSQHAQLGDVGLVLNTETGDNCYAVYADVGPSSKIGEGSIRLAEALGIDSNAKNGGTEKKIVTYLVFPGSVGCWTPPAEWFQTANDLTKSWGGLSRLIDIAATI